MLCAVTNPLSKIGEGESKEISKSLKVLFATTQALAFKTELPCKVVNYRLNVSRGFSLKQNLGSFSAPQNPPKHSLVSPPPHSSSCVSVVSNVQTLENNTILCCIKVTIDHQGPWLYAWYEHHIPSVKVYKENNETRYTFQFVKVKCVSGCSKCLDSARI